MTMTMTRIDRGSTPSTTIYSEGRPLLRAHVRRAAGSRLARVHRSGAHPRWWGRHGTTTTVVEMDVRPGGRWRYRNSASDRGDVVFFGEYLSVDPPTEYRWTFNFELDGEVEGGPRLTDSWKRTAGRRSPRSATWASARISTTSRRPAWSPARSRRDQPRRCAPSCRRAASAHPGPGRGRRSPGASRPPRQAARSAASAASASQRITSSSMSSGPSSRGGGSNAWQMGG